MGLTICRQLTELMGGTIGVESEVGRGSTFFVDLTLPIQQGASEPLVEFSPVMMSGLQVLIVDDNATNRRVLVEQLSSWGCEPRETASAAEALTVLSEAVDLHQPFRVAIIDMQMPGTDGEQLGRLIRNDARFDEMPMILYTSIGDHGTADQMRKRGFAVVLMKPARQSQLFNAMLSVLGERQLIRPHEASMSNEKKEPLGLKVLLAEDNEINQMVAKLILDRFGCEVQTVQTGRQAVDSYAKTHFDVILMDVQMPEMDGYSATSEIRRQEVSSGGHIPIIAMTAKAMPGDREFCIAAGMDDYIVKPVRPDDLYTVLLHWRPMGQILTEPA